MFLDLARDHIWRVPGPQMHILPNQWWGVLPFFFIKKWPELHLENAHLRAYGGGRNGTRSHLCRPGKNTDDTAK